MVLPHPWRLITGTARCHLRPKFDHLLVAKATSPSPLPCSGRLSKGQRFFGVSSLLKLVQTSPCFKKCFGVAGHSAVKPPALKFTLILFTFPAS